MQIFLKYIHACLCIGVYIQNTFTQYSHVLCKHKTFILDAINGCTTLNNESLFMCICVCLRAALCHMIRRCDITAGEGNCRWDSGRQQKDTPFQRTQHCFKDLQRMDEDHAKTCLGYGTR